MLTKFIDHGCFQPYHEKSWHRSPKTRTPSAASPPPSLTTSVIPLLRTGPHYPCRQAALPLARHSAVSFNPFPLCPLSAGGPLWCEDVPGSNSHDSDVDVDSPFGLRRAAALDSGEGACPSACGEPNEPSIRDLPNARSSGPARNHTLLASWL
jgi:hypothetical protein